MDVHDDLATEGFLNEGHSNNFLFCALLCLVAFFKLRMEPVV